MQVSIISNFGSQLTFQSIKPAEDFVPRLHPPPPPPCLRPQARAPQSRQASSCLLFLALSIVIRGNWAGTINQDTAAEHLLAEILNTENPSVISLPRCLGHGSSFLVSSVRATSSASLSINRSRYQCLCTVRGLGYDTGLCLQFICYPCNWNPIRPRVRWSILTTAPYAIDRDQCFPERLVDTLLSIARRRGLCSGQVCQI